MWIPGLVCSVDLNQQDRCIQIIAALSSVDEMLLIFSGKGNQQLLIWQNYLFLTDDIFSVSNQCTHE